MIEQEIKLCWVGAAPDLTVLLGPPIQIRTLANTYFDTADQSLAQQGYGLRLRRDGDQIEQTLKGPAPDQSGIAVRREWSWDRDAFCIDPELLPIEVGELEVVSHNHVQRQVWQVEGCEVVMDQGQVHVGSAHSPIAEIEVEAVQADWAGVLRVAQRLAGAVPCYIGAISKAERGHLLSGRASPPDRSALDGLGRALDPIKGPDWERAEYWAEQISQPVADLIRARNADVAGLCLVRMA